MNHLFNHYYIILFVILGELIFAQKGKYSDYYEIQRQYENRVENDSSALPLVEVYIQKAKKEKKYRKLVLGYKDAIVFSPRSDIKLKYADSVICAAIMTKDNNLISNAYMNKGVVYYFNFRKYKLALEEYLKAYEYCRDSKDEYHKNRLRYLIGVVKSYIGYYDEALVEFKQTRSFFESESQKNLHPNQIYGNRRGYFNSLHQMAVCYRNLREFKAADSLISIGLSTTKLSSEYNQENAYFLKEKGIREFDRKEYGQSIITLESALKEINAVNDFAWTTLCYSYIAKSQMRLGNMDKAILYFEKVDSILNKHDFVLPEARDNYELLINYYQGQNNATKELYYTRQLLKADNVINRDFAYLSSKIHKEYDTQALQEKAEVMERKSSRYRWMNMFFIPSAVLLSIALYYRYRSEKRIKAKYELLEQKILKGENRIEQQPQLQLKNHNGLDLESEVLVDILERLEKFEKNQGYLESGLTIQKLASKLATNRNYLSQIISDYRGLNYNRYINELRIGFITDKLYKEKKYLNYKIETLAEECGIASRSNFSNIFYAINGIRPGDFIKKRLEAINKDQNQTD